MKKGIAVVRNYEVHFERPNINTASERVVLVVTVLNGKNSDAAAELNINVKNNFSSLKNFSGEIFDRNGNSVRKIKKKDLKYTEYSNEFASDYATYYYEPLYPSYPYTVRYEWTIDYKNGILAFPTFDPVPNLYCPVEKAAYRLTLPSGTVFHSRNFNIPDSSAEPQKSVIKDKDIYEWKLENIAAIEPEPFAPVIADECYPMIYFSPHEFSYDGITGYMDSWKSYSKWQWKLLAERRVLPEELKQKIDLMTSGVTSPIEKIKILYDYLAATTRYVSIQIGIGGFQPMTATEVYKTGFGDCKALSNYMQAMLAHCGIKSYYTEIGAMTGQRVLPNFANVYFTNHAILQVPIDNDTLWLECTNPKLPLGYTHDDIAGRYALVYRDSTAYPVMVNSYPDSLHLSEIKAEIDLATDGSFQGRVTEINHMNRYIYHMNFAKMSNNERINDISSSVNIATPYISSVSYTENKSIKPVSTINYNIEARNLGSKTGKRIFVNVSPLRKTYDVKLSKSGRRFPIVIENGDLDKDETVINLPVGASIEVLPKPIGINSKFGNYSLTISLDKSNSDGRIGNGALKIKRSLLLRSGKYPVENYSDFKTFMDAVAGNDNAEIILKFD
jgi:transglutaminase-like putative cysteine protease